MRAAQRVLPGDVPAIPWQRVPDLAGYGLTPEAAAESVRWVDSSGAVARGHEAVAHLLIHAGGPWSVAGRALLLPVITDLARAVYEIVARNRDRLPGGTPACRVPQPGAADEGTAGN